jgi:hypothetical protein
VPKCEKCEKCEPCATPTPKPTKKPTPTPTPVPTPTATPLPTYPTCVVSCNSSHGFTKLSLNFQEITSISGALADKLNLNGSDVEIHLTLLFKADHLVRMEGSAQWNFTKASYCFEIVRNGQIVHARSGDVRMTASMTASINSNGWIVIRLVDAMLDLTITLKKASGAFSSENPWTQAELSRIAVADLDGQVTDDKDKSLTVHVFKERLIAAVEVCAAKTVVRICPAGCDCHCDQKGKCRAIRRPHKVVVATTSKITKNHPIFKIEPMWRGCQGSVAKSEDFLIELISIRECVGKTENCMRQVFDFSDLVVSQTGNNTFRLVGKLDIVDSTSSAVNMVYVEITVSFDDTLDQMSLSIVFNKAGKFQWIPANGNKIRFTFKINGRDAVVLLRTVPNGKVDTSFTFGTVAKGIALNNEKNERQLIDVPSNLTLSFPAKANGQLVKFVTNTTRQANATYIDLEFWPANFNAGVVNYGPILGSLSFRNLPESGPVVDDSSSAMPVAQQDSSEQFTASSAGQVTSWMHIL